MSTEGSGREANILTRTRSGRAVRRGRSSRSGRLLDACGVRVGERRAGHAAVVRVVPVARVLRHLYLLRRLRRRALLRTGGTRRRGRRHAARVRSRRGGDRNLFRRRSRRRGRSSAGQLRRRGWTLLLHLLWLMLWRTLHLLSLLSAGRRRRGAHVLDVLQVLLLELLVLLVLELLVLIVVAARLLLTGPYRYAVRGRPGRPIRCASRRRACQRCSRRSLLLALL